MIDCSGPYHSEYTIDVDGGDDIKIVTDTMRFTQTDGGFVGEGQAGADGDTMVLRLVQRGLRLVGTWTEEQRATGGISGCGVVFFELNTDRIGGMIGQWDTDAGSWALVKQPEQPQS